MDNIGFLLIRQEKGNVRLIRRARLLNYLSGPATKAPGASRYVRRETKRCRKKILCR
jgi:hypothetical protein